MSYVVLHFQCHGKSLILYWQLRVTQGFLQEWKSLELGWAFGLYAKRHRGQGEPRPFCALCIRLCHPPVFGQSQPTDRAGVARPEKAGDSWLPPRHGSGSPVILCLLCSGQTWHEGRSWVFGRRPGDGPLPRVLSELRVIHLYDQSSSCQLVPSISHVVADCPSP